MRLLFALSCLFGGIVAFSQCNKLASALAGTIEPCVSTGGSPPAHMQFEQVMGNLSYLLGWTLVGAAVSDDELDLGCANIANVGHGKWAAQGLDGDYIQQPLCNASHGSPSPAAALPYMLQYSTSIFTTQLLNSFAANNTDAYSYLCNNLRYIALDSFNLDDARLINATCVAGGEKLPPRPASSVPDAGVSNSTVQAYWNTISILYGTLFVSSAKSDSQANILCAHAPNHIANLNKMLMNGTLVADTICQFAAGQAPLSISESACYLKTWSTRAFITVVESISNVDGWLTWLGKNLDAGAMAAVGLDAEFVLSEIQQNANASTSSSPSS